MSSMVKNGDFEEENIGGKPYEVVNRGDYKLKGWVVEEVSIDIISTRTGANDYAKSGQQALDMAGTPGRGTIYQDLRQPLPPLHSFTASVVTS
jgi:hypothetical protein